MKSQPNSPWTDLGLSLSLSPIGSSTLPIRRICTRCRPTTSPPPPARCLPATRPPPPAPPPLPLCALPPASPCASPHASLPPLPLYLSPSTLEITGMASLFPPGASIRCLSRQIDALALSVDTIQALAEALPTLRVPQCCGDALKT
jgi:hypothetical protein